MATSAACRLDSNSTRRRRTTHPCTHARNRAWSRTRARSFSTHHHHTCEETFRQLIRDLELLLTRNACRLRAVMPTQTHPEPLAPLTPQTCARAAPYGPRFVSPYRLHPRHTFLSFSRSPQLAARGAHRSQVTLIEMGAFGSPTRMLVRHLHHTGEQRQVNDLQQPAREIVPHGDSRISERHRHFSLCVFFACAVVASRRRARRWSPPPAPRRARAPAASTPHPARARRRLLSQFSRASTHGRPTNERCDEWSAGVADWVTARRGNTERTLTAVAGFSPRDPYRHSLAMRPPRKVRPFV